MTTTVPKLSITDKGVSIPEEPLILEGVLAGIDAAFGGGLNRSLSTPQGQLAQSLTAIIGDKNTQILEVSNQIDPERNSGRWQDAIGRIYFMERMAGRGTVVQATCYGLVGSLIPAGSLAQDTNGYIYASTADAVIGADGSVVVQFQNQTPGPIACPQNSLTRIYLAVTGWERIDNAHAGVLGAEVENRYDFEQRRRNSVAIASTSMVASVRAALWAVPGVTDVYVAENDTDAPITLGATNYQIPAHCLYVCVAGGSADDIARAIQSRKSAGCNTVGNNSLTIEVRDGYAYPFPSYTFRWQTPNATPIYFDISLVNDSRLPADIVQQVKNAVVSAFAGLDGKQRAQIGTNIYAGRYYSAVQSVHSAVQISGLTIGKTSGAGQGAIEVGIDEMPTLDLSNINVTVA